MSSISQALQSAFGHHQAGRLDVAVNLYQQVLLAEPRQADALHLLGVAMLQAGQHADAVEYLSRAVAENETNPVYFNHLGAAYGALGQTSRAEAAFRAALRVKPDFAEVQLNLGLLLAGQCRQDEAIECYRKAVAIEPRFALAHNNLGISLAQSGRLDEALASYERALEIQNDFPEAHVNRSHVWLARGDFERGWQEYEWRWKSAGYAPPPHHASRWNGDNLAGRTVLLDAEQGLGDTMQFARYAAVLRQQAARVVVRCQGPLVELMRRCKGVDAVVAKDDPLPEFDLVAPMLSLPTTLGTSVDSVPAEVPYLSPDPDLSRRWGRELATYAGYKIGVVWQGSRKFQSDRLRSFPLVELEALAALHGVKLLALQKGPGSEQLAVAQSMFSIKDLGPRLDEAGAAFADTAAVMTHLDLVISSDTAAAHLAGALGVPVWLALPYVAEWRWLIDRQDSPWYPTMRLFRQPSPGDWTSVFAQMAAELAGRFSVS